MKTLNVIYSLFILTFCFGQTVAQVQVGAWQMHKGIDQEPISFTVGFHGDPKAYEKKNIPEADAVGWEAAPVDATGKVNFSETSSLACKTQLDFTYFQSNVFIPEGMTVSEFAVFYDKADDGARIYIFNSGYPNGYFNPDADLKLNNAANIGNVNFSDKVKAGEVNRVVIVQFDDCASGNQVKGINIKVNGTVVKAEEEVLPDPVETTVCCSIDSLIPSNEEIKVGQWLMHRGIVEEPFACVLPFHGSPEAYAKMNIPPLGHSGWITAPVNDEGKVHFEEKTYTDCLKEVDFTYFESNIYIPEHATINEFKVHFDNADDGARIYFFNSAHLDGYHDPNADLIIFQNTSANANFKDAIVPGEVNRVVVVQFDDCGNNGQTISNRVEGINIEINGEVQEVATIPMGCANLIGRWTFEKGVETKDLTGNFDDLELMGQNGKEATITNGALKVGTDAWAHSIGYEGTEIKDKTLVAWVKLNEFEPRGGSVLTIDKTNVDIFDGITFAELQPKQWIAGSNNYKRTNKTGSTNTFRESETNELMMMAITYKEVEGENEISIYRNGELLDQYRKSDFSSYKDNVEITMGVRHTYHGDIRGFVNATIEEARIYDGALCQSAIQDLELFHGHVTALNENVKPNITAHIQEGADGFSYGYGNGTPGNFTAFTENNKVKGPKVTRLSHNTNRWWSIAQNNTESPFKDRNHVTYPPLKDGVLVMHPGSEREQRAKVQYIAPSAGTYKVHVKWTLVDDQAATVKAEIFSNHSGSFQKIYDKQVTKGTSETYDDNLVLKKGDIILFEVENDGRYTNDSTEAEFSVVKQ